MRSINFLLTYLLKEYGALYIFFLWCHLELGVGGPSSLDHLHPIKLRHCQCLKW